jgi:hypothetical protein
VAVPIACHVAPSADVSAVTWVSWRVSRSHSGSVVVAAPLWSPLKPYWWWTPWPGVTARNE